MARVVTLSRACPERAERKGGNAIIGTVCPEASGRDDGEYESAVRRTKYIHDNPMNWNRDRFNR
jgi:hypothetical protein